MQIERTNENADRYKYDFDVCHFGKGWAQIDTSEDAYYYGQWANPCLLYTSPSPRDS